MNRSVLVTGGTGYVGSWVVKLLLEKGYTVRLTTRDKTNTEKLEHLTDIALKCKGELEIWEADLLEIGSFNSAMKDCDAVIHMASPFFLQTTNPQKDLIDPALIGTENVLNAASLSDSVKKIVLTSSVAAIYGDNIDMKNLGIDSYTEKYYNETSSVTHQPYSYSKICAERKAWEIAKNQNQWEMVVINPALVMGPPLGKISKSESLTIMKNFLKGKYRMGVPAIDFAFVDVRDVAKAHVLALENDKVSGRVIISESEENLYNLGKIIEEVSNKQYKAPRIKAPKFVASLMAPSYGLTRKFIKRNAGFPLKFEV